MSQMETDLGTRLDWVAVDHYNTSHPHTHIIVRGKDDREQNLIIAREYISTGLRERAAELVSLDLGPKTDREIEDRPRREMEQERFTSIDKKLIKDMDAERVVSAAATIRFSSPCAPGDFSPWDVTVWPRRSNLGAGSSPKILSRFYGRWASVATSSERCSVR